MTPSGSRPYHLITRNDRLEKIAEDIVLHFMGRGFQGKAMVVSVDKATAVRMFDKVQKYWKMHLAELMAEYEARSGKAYLPGKNPHEPSDSEEQAFLADLWDEIRTMLETDMAVVISQGQNEIAEMRERGLNIIPHRRRMVEEDLDTKFKDPADPLRIVFVCAMWMTGFDVPSCSTIYLDKPMRNHTLMQTIARANRVWREKVNGLIVDYIGVFRDLQRALAIYGSASGGGVEEGDMPVETKQALVEELAETIQEVRGFLAEYDVELDELHQSEGFERVNLLDEAVDAVLVNDDTKHQYLTLAGNVDRLFHAILPDEAASQFGVDRKAIVVIADKIRSLTPAADISGVMIAVDELLDESIVPTKEGYVISEPVSGGHYLDLSKVDFEALKKRFKRGRKRIEAEKLRGSILSKLRKMVRLNRRRLDYYQKFQELIDEYNAGAKNVDAFYAELISLARNLSEEEQRGIAENLSEEELALFDLLTQPDPQLSRKEQEQVKDIARDLLDTLKAERLVLDWRKNQQTRAGVQVTIRDVLYQLPDAYDEDLFQQKLQLVYQHVYDSYYGEGKSIYASLAA